MIVAVIPRPPCSFEIGKWHTHSSFHLIVTRDKMFLRSKRQAKSVLFYMEKFTVVVVKPLNRLLVVLLRFNFNFVWLHEIILKE